jgi:L-lysine exporter family protein LysE/ArgO
MSWASFPVGFALGGSLIIAIGAQNAFVLRQGLQRQHVGLVVAFCACADIALMAAGVFGIGAAAGDHPRVLLALAAGGVLFLSYYGLSALRRAGSPQRLDAAGGAERNAAAVLAQVAAFTLLNPHVYLDTVVLVGTLGAQQPEGGRLPFLLGACTASVLWFTGLGYGARTLAPLFARPLAWRILDGVIGVTMFALAAGLAFATLTGDLLRGG